MTQFHFPPDLRLSETKLVGYAGTFVLEDAWKWWRLARRRGHEVIMRTDVYRPNVTWVMVFDEKRLQAFLDARTEILDEEGWPTGAQEFALELWARTAGEGPLYDLIAEAFGNRKEQDQ